MTPLRLEYLCLYGMGINIIPENGEHFIASKAKLRIQLGLSMTIAISMMIYAVQNYKDISEFALAVCVVIPYGSSAVKTIILSLHGTDFTELIRTVRELAKKGE